MNTASGSDVTTEATTEATTTGATSEVPPPGRLDPRVDRTRRAVLDAVVMLITDEGTGSVTHQRVAEVSGVGRATLYRHWPTAAELLYDVLEDAEQPLLRPRDEPLIPWLRTELRRAAVELATPTAVQFLSVLIGRADHDASAAELRRRVIDQDVLNVAVAVARAAARGEIVGEPDPHELYAMLTGPILMRASIERRTATESFVDRVIDAVMAPWLPSETN